MIDISNTADIIDSRDIIARIGDNPVARHLDLERALLPVAGKPAHLDLRIGRLAVELVGDDPADRLGRIARSADAARIGHENEARAIDLNLVQNGRVQPLIGEQPVFDILVDGQTQRVAGADRVRADNAGPKEMRREPERRHDGRRPRDPGIDRHHEGIALSLHRSFEDFSLARARTRKCATGQEHG